MIKKRIIFISLILCLFIFNLYAVDVYISYHWHMHQPIYWPYENVVDTQNNPESSDHPLDYFAAGDRIGAYTHYPLDAIERAQDQPHWGAQVSFSGSLIENLNNIESAGECGGAYYGWKNRWRNARGLTTTKGNPRLDLVGFGYHHPLMGLIDKTDIEIQIKMHKKILLDTFGGTYSKGIFPPENAFSVSMIPALLEEGFEWVMVDNIHMDRCNIDYPWDSRQKMIPPNKANQMNPAQGTYWDQSCETLTTTKVSAFAYRPHYAQYVDPETGTKYKIIVVPTARSLGYNDSYGNRGPNDVTSALASHNTDPAHPLIAVLAHDGDNASASGSMYYNETMSWVTSPPAGTVPTTIQDYLDMYPPDLDDVIHIEDGSWMGADIGNMEFSKWNGEPYYNGAVDYNQGYSADRNSWAVLTAVKNRLMTAQTISPYSSIDDIINCTGNNTAKAWHYYLVSQTSCYWYWDGTKEWDSKPTLACNQAVPYIDAVLGSNPPDTVAPTIFYPNREPYNPGGEEWGVDMPSDFTVYTYVYDVSGLEYVYLKYRIDEDGANTIDNTAYWTYAGGTKCGEWKTIVMTGKDIPGQNVLAPLYKANRYSASITGYTNTLIDYYIEAKDRKGNIAKSEICHVYVGKYVAPNPGGDLWSPANPTKNDIITIKSTKPGKLHWGINGWTEPPSYYWPSGTTAWGDGKAVDTSMAGPDGEGNYSVQIGPFNQAQEVTAVNFVFHYSDDTWDVNHSINIDNSTINTNPVVSVNYPANNSTVQGLVTVAATASDDKGVTKVEFYVNNSLKHTDTDSPYNFSWDTTSYANITYQLKAIAYDTDNNYTSSSIINVTVNNSVNNPPNVTLLTPVGGEKWSGNQNIQWNATDSDGDILKITIQYNYNNGVWNTLINNINNSGSYSFNTKNLPNGDAYKIKVIASDELSSSSAESGLFFTITNSGGDYKSADIDKSQFVDGNDLMLLGVAYNTTNGDTKWNADADLNNDNKVNTNDLAIFSLYYGQEVSAPPGPPSDNHPPTVLVTSFTNEGVVLSGTNDIKWIAQDEDNDTISITIKYRYNNGDWNTIVQNIGNVGSYSWNTHLVQNGNNYQIKVIADDGTVSVEDLGNYSFTINNGSSGSTNKGHTITIDGDGSDWLIDTDTIATDKAWDHANCMNGAWATHETPFDYVRLLATWDDNYLYVGIQIVDVTDITDPANAGSSHGTPPTSMNMPQWIAINTKPGGYSGTNNTGDGSKDYDMWHKGQRFGGVHLPDYMLYFASNMWQGPFLCPFPGTGGGWNPDVDTKGPADGLKGASKAGSYGDIWGWNSDHTAIVNYANNGHDRSRDSFFEIAIPLSLIGNPNPTDIYLFVGVGDGDMKSGVDSIPDDPATLDTPGVESWNSPLEWSDIDVFTVPFARVGHTP